MTARKPKRRWADAMTRYALFHNGRQISKAHSTRNAAVIEAIERKLAIWGSGDFLGDVGVSTVALPEGYDIKEVQE